MEKRVLLIGKSKSFMVNAIVIGLQKYDYVVQTVEPDSKAIDAFPNKPKIYLFYLGDLTEEDASLFSYVNERLDAERFLLYMIGNNEELKLATQIIAKEKVQEMYLRPLDVKLLAEHLNKAVDFGSVEDVLRKKVLIVDDDGAMLRMLKTWLSVKYHVYMASSGKIALSFLQQNKVDLILLDYEMPVMSGPDVLLALRTDHKLSGIPVIFLTAKDDKESVMRVVNLKPSKYLLKSMPKEKLIGAIDDFFTVQDSKNI